MAASTAEKPHTSELWNFFKRTKTPEELQEELLRTSTKVEVMEHIQGLVDTYDTFHDRYFRTNDKLRGTFKRLRLYPIRLNQNRVDVADKEQVEELFELLRDVYENPTFSFLINPTTSAQLIAEQSQERNPTEEEKEAFKKELREKKTEEAETRDRSWGRDLDAAEDQADGEEGEATTTAAKQVSTEGSGKGKTIKAATEPKEISYGPRQRTGFFLSKANSAIAPGLKKAVFRIGFPAANLVKSIPRSRLIPALGVGVAGLAAFGPGGGAAGAAIGYLGGQTILEPIVNGGAESASPSEPAVSAPPQTEALSSPETSTNAPVPPSSIPPRGKPAPPLSNPLSAVKSLAGGPFGSYKKQMIIFFVVFGAIVLFMLMLTNQSGGGGFGGGGGATTAQNTGTSTGGDISQCSFYFNGSPTKIGSSGIAGVISDAAGKAGVPASLLAGIVERESQSAIASNDTSYVTNDYDAHPNHGCDPSTSDCAIGVTQFKRGTFSGIFNAHATELAVLGKTSDDITIVPQSDYNPNTSSFRIISIKDSILATAYAIKDYQKAFASDPSQWNADIITKIGEKYYTGNLDSGCPDNYCDDLVKDYQNCSAGSTVTPPVATSDVEQLVQSIQNSCNYNGVAGTVTSSNSPACIDNASPPVPSRFLANKSFLIPQGFWYQCVEFAQAILQRHFDGITFAVNLANVGLRGYTFYPVGSTKAQAGDLIVWSGGTTGAGHVAYVVKVIDDNSFEIAEANYDKLGLNRNGMVETRNIGYDNIKGDGLIIRGFLRP